MNNGKDLSTLAPDTPFWAVGDVHGRDDLLGPLLDRIMADGIPVVLVGDYINKGPDSATVLRRLHRLSQDGQVIALRGNHEELLLRFLTRPRRHAKPFLRFGGQTTLDSFGQAALPMKAPLPANIVARDALRGAMGPVADWLVKCPYQWRSGNVCVMHAGADPALPLDAQPQKTFVWGHPRFADQPRSDGQWVVHGHAQVPQVTVQDKRIAIDTGAFETGKLSAVRISQGEITPL